MTIYYIRDGEKEHPAPIYSAAGASSAGGSDEPELSSGAAGESPLSDPSSSSANANLTARPTLVGTSLIDLPSFVGTLLRATANRCISSCFVGSFDTAITPLASRTLPAKMPVLIGSCHSGFTVFVENVRGKEERKGRRGRAGA